MGSELVCPLAEVCPFPRGLAWSWTLRRRLVMEYINEDCMTDASDPSYSTPFFPYENNGESFLQITNSQIETNSYCLVLSS